MATPKLLFANNASAPLDSTLSDSSTTIYISTGYEILFPIPDYPTNTYKITLENAQDGLIEICEVTNRVDNVLTVLRAREGTSAQTFVASRTSVQIRVTKGTLERFLQSTDTLTAGQFLQVGTAGDITSTYPIVISASEPSNPVPSTQWLRTVDNSFWVWDGDEWINTGADVQGPKGDTGAQGLQGVPGATGRPGTVGAPSNVPGPTGQTGTTGATGPQGDDGSQWLHGIGAPGNPLGDDGDIYHNDQNNDLYQKASGTWTFFANIKGDPGTGSSISDHSDLTGTGAADCHPIDSITGLRTVLNSKIRNFYQPGEPTGGTYYDGYMWLDSDNYNYPSRHNGTSWVAVPPVRALTDGRVGTDGISNGAITIDKLASSAVDTGNIVPGAIDATTFASTISPVHIETTLPTLPDAAYPPGSVVFLTTDGLLYRNDSDVWVNTVPAASVVGELVSSQLADGAITTAKLASQIQAIEVVGTLPPLPDSDYGVGAVVYYTGDGKLYRSNSLQWTAAVPTTDLTGDIASDQIADGAINTAKFAAGLEPVHIVTSLPTLPDSGYPQGSVVFLTTDQKLYRNTTGSAWSAAVAAADVSGQLTDAQIADLQTAKLTGFIQGTQIASNAITTPKIAAGAITTSQLAADAVTANNIAANTITAAEIAANAITASEIASSAVTTTKLAADAVTAGKIAAGAVTASEISAGAVSADKIASNAITTAKIAAGAVTATKILSNSITATQIAANAITASELAADSVVAGKIAAAAVSATEIASNAITTVKLNAGAVTAAKIATNTITATQIAAGAITASELAANSVIAGKIAAGAISATEIASNAITTAKLAASAVSADKIAANAVTADKINAAKLVSASDVSTLFGQDTTGQRLEIEGSSTYPLWYGTGTKSEANAKMFLKSDGTMKYVGGGSNDSVSSTTAHFLKQYPVYRVVPYASNLDDVTNGPTHYATQGETQPIAWAYNTVMYAGAGQEVAGTYTWPAAFGDGGTTLYHPSETTLSGGGFSRQRLANKATPILIMAYVRLYNGAGLGDTAVRLQYRYNGIGSWINLMQPSTGTGLDGYATMPLNRWYTPPINGGLSNDADGRIDFRVEIFESSSFAYVKQVDINLLGFNIMSSPLL